MTMRAVIERDGTATDNAWGQPDAPSWATFGDPVPCWVSSDARRHAIDVDKDALVEDLRIMFPKGTGITENDRIASITDRLGTVLYTGPIHLEAGQYKHDHVEFALTRVK
jgi:hypothetical protein